MEAREASRRRVALDLGCGKAKAPGFIGADRVPLPGVDVVIDLDAPFPFASDSVDLVLMSHSLEHVRELIGTMREVYRVCRHGAQVCIVAPYHNQGLNLANPYHVQVLNEHSPRFWTASSDTPVAAAEFYHPHAPEWGLSRSDNSDPGIDFRCLRMEFFYFPEYRNLSPEEQRTARKRHPDVCDQILYQLRVVKRPASEAEMSEAIGEAGPYEPPYVTLRKTVERADRLAADLAAAAARGEAAEVERSAAVERCRVLEDALGEAERSAAAASRLRERESELERVWADLAERNTELERLESAVASARASLAARASEADTLRGLLARREGELAELSRKATTLAGEVDLFRRRRLTRWLERLDRSDLREGIGPAFRQLLDDGLLFQDLRGFRLRPGRDLRHVPFVAYPLPPVPPGLRGLLLAPLLDLPRSPGTIGIEIVSPADRIIAQATVPLESVGDAAPARIAFPPLPSLGPGTPWLRVFVRDAPTPVRVLEWSRHDLGGLGRERRRAFCGFVLGS